MNYEDLDNAPPLEDEEEPAPRYNHACTLAFDGIISNDPNGDDITSEMLREALLRRIADLDEEDSWCEACLAPFDSYEMDEDELEEDY